MIDDCGLWFVSVSDPETRFEVKKKIFLKYELVFNPMHAYDHIVFLVILIDRRII